MTIQVKRLVVGAAVAVGAIGASIAPASATATPDHRADRVQIKDCNDWRRAKAKIAIYKSASAKSKKVGSYKKGEKVCVTRTKSGASYKSCGKRSKKWALVASRPGGYVKFVCTKNI